MKQEVLANFPYTWLTVVGFFLFLSVFIGMIIWVFKKDSKKHFDNCSRIPFEGERS